MKAVTLVVIFCVFISNGESTFTENFDIIQNGKHCVEAAKTVVEATNKPDADEALEHLKSLQADKEHLAQHAKSTISSLERTQSEKQKELDQTEKEIGKLAQTEQDLKQEKARLEVTLKQQQQTLRDNEGKVAEENRVLEHARDRLKKAKKSAKKKKKKGGLIGGLVGLATGGVGAGIVGGIAGAAGAEIINKIKGDIDRAKDKLHNQEHAVNEAKRAVSETQNHINNLNHKISEIPGQIERKRSERARRHDETGKIKTAIIFQRKSAQFWNMFLIYTEDAGEQTSYLKKIVEMATKMEDWNILRSGGTRLFQATFLEAWEEVESAAKKSGSYYNMFLIE